MRSLILAVALAAAAIAQAPEAMLRSAMDKESVDGDLKAAIEQYKKIVASKGASREVVAKALVRLGACYERQGDVEARKAYERVVREFGDQADAVRQAQARLAADRPTPGSGVAVRHVWNGPSDSFTGGQISLDGRYFAYADWGNGDLAVRDLSTGQNRLITHMPVGNSDGVEGPCWSHDGKRIAHSFEKPDWHIRVVNADGTGMRTLYNTANGEGWAYAVGWSADDKRILADVQQKDKNVRMFWITVADGAVQPINSAATTGSEHLSPDGRYIAFGSKGSGGQSNVRIMSADGSGETWLTEHPASEWPVGWSPDSRYVLFASYRTGGRGLWAQSVANGRAQGSPVLIRQDMGRSNWGSAGLTRSGILYYIISTPTSDIYTASMNPATGNVTSAPVPVPTSRSGLNSSPRWSPDSRQILYVWGTPSIWNSADARRELSVYSFDSQKDQPVARREVLAGNGKCWSGDGASILFNRVNADMRELVKFNLSSTEATPLLQKGGNWGSSCSDRLTSYFTGHPHGPKTIAVRSIPDGAERTIYKFPDHPYAGLAFPQISHDGRSVAFFADVEAPAGSNCMSQSCWSALLVVPTDGGPAKELVQVKHPGGFQRYGGQAWSPDDRFVYFLKRNDAKAPYEMFRVAAAGGQIESTGLKTMDLRDIDIAPDGKRVAFSIGAIDKPELWTLENFLPTTK